MDGKDHPRACGKHSFFDGLMSMIPGSPPRLRETQFPGDVPPCVVRITPAPAGNTEPRQNITDGVQDHPRACGKHLLPNCWRLLSGGSPPRLRETHVTAPTTGVDDRITPAPAGNTSPRCDNFGAEADHPRACGKHQLLTGVATEAKGSPPRLRETPLYLPY